MAYLAPRMRWVLVLVIAACGSSSDLEVDASSGAVATGDAPGAPSAADLLGKLATCRHAGGNYASDAGAAETIEICAAPGALFWKADLDVDCDGKPTAKCSAATDADYQSQTSATD